MTGQRRVRLVEWPVPNPPNLELCTPAGCRELGGAVVPGDDLVLLYPPGTDVERWVAMLRAEGYDVWTGPS